MSNAARYESYLHFQSDSLATCELLIRVIQADETTFFHAHYRFFQGRLIRNCKIRIAVKFPTQRVVPNATQRVYAASFVTWVMRYGFLQKSLGKMFIQQSTIYTFRLSASHPLSVASPFISTLRPRWQRSNRTQRLLCREPAHPMFSASLTLCTAIGWACDIPAKYAALSKT